MYKKSALSCEKKTKLPFFNFSRRSSDLVVRKFLLIQKWIPTIHPLHKKKERARSTSALDVAYFPWIYFRKSSKCITFKSIAPSDHDSCQLAFWRVDKFLSILLLYLRPAQGPFFALSVSSFVKFATDAIITIFKASMLMLQILKSLWCYCIWYTCHLGKDTPFRPTTFSFFFCCICFFFVFLQQLLLLLARNFVAEDKILFITFLLWSFQCWR